MRSLIAQGRFALSPIVMAVGVAALAAGGGWVWLGGILLLTVNTLGDEATDEFLDVASRTNAVLINTVVHGSLVLVALMTVALLAVTASPGTPLAGLGGWLGRPGPASWVEFVGAAFSCGMLTGVATVAQAHELIHRGNRRDWLLGQCVAALCLHPSMVLSHVFDHHINVGTPADASTAPRGMGFWRFFARAYAWENRSAAAIEARRLARRGLPFASPANRFIQGLAMLASLLCLTYWLAGAGGLLAFLFSGFGGLVHTQSGNYVSHYGLVRLRGRPIEPRHSWNAPRFFSTSTLLNVARHSHHHASAGTPFWKLAVPVEAPVHPHGWPTIALVALVPPIWFRMMGPCLANWDARFASGDELAALRDARTALPTAEVGRQERRLPAFRRP